MSMYIYIYMIVDIYINICIYIARKRSRYPLYTQNRETRIPQYLVVQIPIDILVSFGFVPWSVSFSS